MDRVQLLIRTKVAKVCGTHALGTLSMGFDEQVSIGIGYLIALPTLRT